MRRYGPIAVLFFCSVALALTPQPSSLITEIRVSQTTVRNSAAKPKPAESSAWPHEFSVATTIRNVSVREQAIHVTLCGFAYQWQVDNPKVYVDGGSCLKNSIITIKLQPGETYTRSISMFVELPSESLGRGPQPVTFRLGFGDSFWNEKLRGEMQAIWSNPITVSVTR